MKDFKTTYDEKQKIWLGITMPRKYPTDYSIGRAAVEAMQQNVEKIGQICFHNDKQYKYKELADLSKSVAQHFTKLGLQQCDVIGICASNSDYLAPLFFGAMLKGLIVSPSDVSYDKEGMRHTFAISKPKLMFCDGSIYERVKAALDENGSTIKIYTMKDHTDGVPTIAEFLGEPKGNKKFCFEPLQKGGSQTAVILCSSGTTGLPKGVTNSHEDLLNISTFMELEPEDRFLCFSPLQWFSGLYTLICGTLTGLTRIINDSGFTPDNLLNIIEKYKVTKLLTPPSQLALTLASPQLKTTDLSSIKYYCFAGSAISYDLVKKMQPFMPNATFINAYGMSEARDALAAGPVIEKSGFVGQLAPNCQYKIVDGNGQRLGPNEIGELYFWIPYKWHGYVGNAQATAAAYDAEGWLMTGDIGYIDDQGNLFLVDRKKEILKYLGFHYFPTEIEMVIYELPDIVEVCVFGLRDLASTDLPAAAVVKKLGSNLTAVEICDHVAKRMADYKHLCGGVFFMEQIPKSSTGKPLRGETRKICEKLKAEEL